MQPLRLVILSGLSGSGKTHAIKCFEDLGFFCVDNLPPALLPKFAELCLQQGGAVRQIALGVDIRERVFFDDLFTNLERLRDQGISVEMLFLEARDEVLARRFSETRRPHPLSPQAPLLEGIKLERERLQNLRRHADQILDTSDLNVHELKDLLARRYLEQGQGRRLTISLLTFGFKFGVPYDLDMLFDVRFVRNPNFVEHLKALTGEDPAVRAYVLNDPESGAFIGHLEGLFKFLIPQFERERRSYLTIAIGCTGGRHRSVAVACRLQEILISMGYDVTLQHRDLHKT